MKKWLILFALLVVPQAIVVLEFTHPWRLYFHIAEEERFFTYAYAVHKDRDEQDPDDVARARRIFNGIAHGVAFRKRFNLH